MELNTSEDYHSIEMLINVSEEQNIPDSKNLLVIKECPTLKKLERLPWPACVASNHHRPLDRERERKMRESFVDLHPGNNQSSKRRNT